MKSIFLIVFILFVSDVFSQYPDWMPEELRNRIFCGDLKTSGRDLYGNSTYITIPYEILVTESGIQMRMNPREQFGEDKWGETIKVKYDLGTVIEDKDYYQKRIKLSLSSDNEAPDSPIYPDYKLESVQINLCTYQDGMVLSRDELRRFQMYKKNRPLPSNIACCIKVPYYTSTCGTARNNYVGSNSCKEILTPAQIKKGQEFAKTTLEKTIEEGRFTDAVRFYTTYESKYEYSNEEQKGKIIEGLKKVYKEKNSALPNSSLKAIIEHNKPLFSKLFKKEGEYNIEFDNNGHSINFQGLILPASIIPKKDFYGFTVPINSSIKIKISRKTEIISQTFDMGKKAFKKELFFHPKKEQFYLVHEVGNLQDECIYVSWEISTKNDELDKNQIVRYYKLNESFYANDILIFEKKSEKKANYNL